MSIVPILVGAELKINDLSIPYNSLFTRATKKAFEIKVDNNTNLQHPRHISGTTKSVCDKLMSFGVTVVGVENLYGAAKAVLADINFLSSRGNITGLMTPLSYIELTSEPHEVEKFIVYCHVSAKGTIFNNGGCIYNLPTLMDETLQPKEYR